VADDEQCLDVAGLVVPLTGGLRETGDPWAPFELSDAAGAVVGPAAEYLKDVQACGRSDATLRSYGMDLLRWFRFCWAAGLEWDQVTWAEARDFCRWLLIAGKPGADGGYAAATAAHCETVLRSLLRFPPRGRDRPDGQPVPAGPRAGWTSGAHRNPMDPFPRGQAGLFRPRVPQRVPRSIPDEHRTQRTAAGRHRSCEGRAGPPHHWSRHASHLATSSSRYTSCIPALRPMFARPPARPAPTRHAAGPTRRGRGRHASQPLGGGRSWPALRHG
jgi:hypothetical protein